jgi:hypothetical protein
MVFSVQLLELNCPRCGYHAQLLLGTQNPDQTFSDLNEDFAYYRLYKCPTDNTLHSMNVHDREWNGDCPQHKGVKLQSLNGPPTVCPKCGGPLEVVEKEILKHEEEAPAQ